MDLSSGKEEPGITDPRPFPPNTNSHSALLWVQLNTLIHASTIHKQESILYPLQHPVRPISGCQPEEAPSRLVASAIIFSSEREAPSGHAPHAVWHSRCHPNERMPWTAHRFETSLREAQFKKYVKGFLHTRYVYHAVSCMVCHVPDTHILLWTRDWQAGIPTYYTQNLLQ